MNNISQKIKQRGYRFTNQRQQILDVLTPFPQSVTEVASSLKEKGIIVDKVTIYRALDCFTDLGIVGKTQFKDKVAKYELLNNDDHHHHLVCDKCGLIEDIPLDDSFLLKKIKRQTDFQIQSHSLEFFGLCERCQGWKKRHSFQLL